MPREVHLFGIYLPSLLLALVATMPIYWLLDSVFARLGVYRWVWHTDLFRLSLFVVMFGALGLHIYR